MADKEKNPSDVLGTHYFKERASIYSELESLLPALLTDSTILDDMDRIEEKVYRLQSSLRNQSVSLELQLSKLKKPARTEKVVETQQLASTIGSRPQNLGLTSLFDCTTGMPNRDEMRVFETPQSRLWRKRRVTEAAASKCLRLPESNAALPIDKFWPALRAHWITSYCHVLAAIEQRRARKSLALDPLIQSVALKEIRRLQDIPDLFDSSRSEKITMTMFREHTLNLFDRRFQSSTYAKNHPKTIHKMSTTSDECENNERTNELICEVDRLTSKQTLIELRMFERIERPKSRRSDFTRDRKHLIEQLINLSFRNISSFPKKQPDSPMNKMSTVTNSDGSHYSRFRLIEPHRDAIALVRLTEMDCILDL
ncbi:hypothetical protein ACOME3_010243 [Neoechinorhynchus agilis]